MDFPPPLSPNPHRRLPAAAPARTGPKATGTLAFSLLETLIATGVASLIALGLASIFLFSSRSSATLSNLIAANQADYLATEVFGQDIRSADCIVEVTSNTLALLSDTTTIRYQYDPANKALLRSVGTNTASILPNCWQICFDRMQLVSNAANFGASLPSTSASSRMVRVQWVSAIHTQSQPVLLITNSQLLVNRQP